MAFGRESSELEYTLLLHMQDLIDKNAKKIISLSKQANVKKIAEEMQKEAKLLMSRLDD